MTFDPQQANPTPEAIIIGAGPVGMLLGCLLGARGVKVLILERRTELPSHSQAIGITPPSLEILSEIGLGEAFIQHGLPIRDCHVHGHTCFLGTASFRAIAGAYPYILSLPQQISMRLLSEKLATYPTVELQRGVEVISLDQDQQQVTLEIRDSDGAIFTRRAAYIAACDGHRSHIRDLLHLRTTRRDYGHHFVMGDFTDRSILGEEAHLYFTAQGAVESFPLPGGLRRWIVQIERPETEMAAGFISETVFQRTGHQIDSKDQQNQSAFSPWRLDCEQLHDGRVILCGDAAHVMSPIGGQGMNTGFADAEFAAAMLHAILHHGQEAQAWLAAYDKCRRVAANTAATRAALGMGLGTWRGVPASLLRDGLLRYVIFRWPLIQMVGPWFAMMTIPFNRVGKSRYAAKQLALLKMKKGQPDFRLAHGNLESV